MNNKMAKIHIYQQLNLKNKLSIQEEQTQNHGMDRVLMVAREKGYVREWVKK